MAGGQVFANRTRSPALIAGLTVALLTFTPPAMASGARVQMLQELYQRQPSPAVLWFLAEAQLANNDKSGAASSLSSLHRQGAGYAPPRRSVFNRFTDDQDLGPIIRMMRGAAHASTSRVAATVDQPDFVAEGIARDPRTSRVFVGDMASRRVLAISPSGQVLTFIRDLPLRPLGLTLDARRRILWVATTNAFWDTTAPQSELRAYDLETGDLLRTLTHPEAKSFNDMAISDTDDLFVTDFYGRVNLGPAPRRGGAGASGRRRRTLLSERGCRQRRRDMALCYPGSRHQTRQYVDGSVGRSARASVAQHPVWRRFVSGRVSSVCRTERGNGSPGASDTRSSR